MTNFVSSGAFDNIARPIVFIEFAATIPAEKIQAGGGGRGIGVEDMKFTGVSKK